MCKRVFLDFGAIVAIGVALGSVVPSARAGSIAIVNAGFEDPGRLPGDYTEVAPPGWTALDPFGMLVSNNSVGVYNVLPGDYPALAPEGLNVAYIYVDTKVTPPPAGATVSLSQVLPDRLEVSTYTLSVVVGNIGLILPIFEGFPGYRVELLAGGVVLAMDDNTLHPGEGEYLTTTVSYTAGVNDPLLGQALEIRLTSLLGDGTDMDFDDVRLTSVPEPSTIVLGLMSSAILLTVMVRRRRGGR